MTQPTSRSTRRRMKISAVAIFDHKVTDFHSDGDTNRKRVFEIFSIFGRQEFVTADPSEDIWCVPATCPQADA